MHGLYLTTQPTLWSKIFKHELEMYHNDEAYSAMLSNPDPERSVTNVIYEQTNNHIICIFKLHPVTGYGLKILIIHL